MNGLLIFGDSITYGPNDGSGWANRLVQAFNKQDEYNFAYNLGIPGDTSTRLLKRLKIECDARILYYRPSNKFHIIIAMGINDSRLTKGSPETEEKIFRKNMEALVKEAQRDKTALTLIGLTPVDQRAARYEGTSFTNERIARYNTIVANVAKENKVPFIDVFAKLNGKEVGPLLDDGLHWTTKGNQVLYRIISDELRSRKVIP
jgi:lysophospholipase L1-like esterase